MKIGTNGQNHSQSKEHVSFISALIRKMQGYLAVKENRRAFSAQLALVIYPVVTFYLFELYTHNPFTDMAPRVHALNLVFFELTAVLFAGLLGRIRTALMVQSGLFMIIGLVNSYVLLFRSTPIMPWDIFSLSTAVSVADNYDYTPEKKMLLVLAGFAVLLLLESRISFRAPRRAGVRLLTVGLSVVFLCGYTALIQSDSFVSYFGLYDKLFTPTVMNKRDGNVVAFIMEMEYLKVEKPRGYSEEDAQQLYEEYESREFTEALESPEDVRRPNIIVIMDEAFSDLSVLGEFETNRDYMPFIRSLQEREDVISGDLHVSVLGGNTANTEFEFLTGHSMAFLPQGSVAYQQYLKQEGVNLTSYLKALGYSTIAMHPYYPGGWERDRVYPMLGFDEFLSIYDFSEADRVRKYVSDAACFHRIIDLYENKEEGTPLFVFNVTMQNHSGYTDDYVNFRPDVEVLGIESKALEQYLSLMKKTDKAFERLISYFEKQEEETLILFFGDHQPTTYVSNPIIRSNGIQPDSLTLEENLLKYKVPYVIWSNFPLNGDMEDKETSVNYLALDVLESCGLPLPPYQSYLKEIRKDYPLITGLQIRDSEGKLSAEGEKSKEEREKDEEALLPYQSLQYYLLFDEPAK